MAKRGLLLFAHGARDARWAAPFEAVAAKVSAGGRSVEAALAYLEFMQPDIAAAAEQLVARGCERIDVVPLFLGAGGHVRNDVPALISELEKRFPATRWHLRPAVGEADRVIEAMAEVALSALDEPGPGAAQGR